MTINEFKHQSKKNGYPVITKNIPLFSPDTYKSKKYYLQAKKHPQKAWCVQNNHRTVSSIPITKVHDVALFSDDVPQMSKDELDLINLFTARKVIK